MILNYNNIDNFVNILFCWVSRFFANLLFKNLCFRRFVIICLDCYIYYLITFL